MKKYLFCWLIPGFWLVSWSAVAALEIKPAAGSAATSIVAPGESYAFEFFVVNRGSEVWQGKLRLRLLDFQEQALETADKEVTLQPGRELKISHAFGTKNQGIHKVEVTAQNPEILMDVASFVVWPKKASLLSDDSFFGVHTNSWDNNLLAQAARLGFRWNRNHNMLQTTWWPRVQAEPGEFQWKHDSSLERNLDNDFVVLGQFFGTPYWAAASGPLPKQSVSPNDSPYPYGAAPNLEAFEEYVTKTVGRYKDRIHYWEIWNEPAVPQFWSSSPEEFAKLAQVAYQAAKKADPTSTVIAAGYTDSTRWNERAADHGALQYSDAISIHIYHDTATPPEVLYGRLKETAEWWHKLATKHVPDRKLPLWQSEGGAANTTWLRGRVTEPLTLNWRQAAIRQVQIDVLMQGLQYARSFYYLTTGTDKVMDLSDLDFGETPKPLMVARAVLAHAVDEARCQQLIQRLEGRTWISIYERKSGGSVSVVWTGSGGQVSLPTNALPGQLTLKDFMGNERPLSEELTINEVPLYLFSSESAAAMIKAWNSTPVQVRAEPQPLPPPATPPGSKAPPQTDYPSARENPASLFTVDLRPFTNMAFADGPAGDGKGGWADEGEFNDFRTFPLGRQVIYGVPFEIIDPAKNKGTSVLTLRGMNSTPTHPVAIKEIAVGGKVRSLFFLHSAASTRGKEIGRYIMHYADGTKTEVPIVLGQNSGDWWSAHDKGEESKPWPVSVINGQDGKPGWRYPRVWEWQNPKPEVELVSLDFVSDQAGTTPILVALSGVRW